MAGQLRILITRGRLEPGARLPSVRTLASDLGVNLNTIARAYQELQSDLVLEPLRGRGMIVRRDAVSRCTKARNTIVVAAVRNVLRDALAGGMSVDDLRALFESELSSQAACEKGAT